MKKLFQSLKNFLKSLFSASGDTSSKRVVGFGSWVLLASQVYANIFAHITVQSELIWAVVAIIASCFGLNALVAMKEISARQTVASDIAKGNPDDPAASKSQEVIENKAV